MKKSDAPSFIMAAMCGRYTQIAEAEELAEEFEVLDVTPYLPRRYNIAPTQTAPVVRLDAAGERRELALLRWGLVPSWAKDIRVGSRMINARSETVATSNAFRRALAARRCLVPCTGFYEWMAIAEAAKPRKQPYFIAREGRRVFALAGLWERWKDADAGEIESFTILTTTPNRLMAELHDRMPVIIEPSDYARWLDPQIKNAAALEDLYRPISEAGWNATAVSDTVNNARNETPACIEPLHGP